MKSKIFITLILICLYQVCQFNNVFAQSVIYGTVTSIHNAQPIQNITVKVIGYHSYVSETDSLGNYRIVADTGNYLIHFTKVGFDTITVDTVLYQTDSVMINAMVYRYPYPVRNVTAVKSEDGQSCLVSWELPKIENEFIYDRGIIDTLMNWHFDGGRVAVKFTPDNYPVIVTGGRLNVGDGSYPTPNWLSKKMKIILLDDNGFGGSPGNALDSIYLRATNYNWVEFYYVFSQEISGGSFYIAMEQLSSENYSPPMGVDTLQPFSGRSYEKSKYDTAWTQNLNKDFLIRAVYEEPYDDLLSDNTLMSYNIGLVENFHPCYYPDSSTITPLANQSSSMLSFVDTYPGGIPVDFRGYMIGANYEYGETQPAFSNEVPPEGDISVIFNISLCDSANSANTIITMDGNLCEFNHYQFVSDTMGVALIDTALSGYYNIKIDKIGYEIIFMDSVHIAMDTSISVILDQKKYAPLNFAVDSTTNIATWDPPLINPLLLETFEDSIFPPEGWQESHETAPYGWFRTDHHNNEDFVVPPGDGFYACADAGYGSGPTHPLDYLITPEIDLRENENYNLIYDSYFTGAYGQEAFVEYSYDNGTIWEVLEEVSPVSSWTTSYVNVSDFSGVDSSPVWFAFHSDDNNSSGSGWAIDNVTILGEEVDFLGYNLSLYNTFSLIQTNQLDTSSTSYEFTNLSYGNDYFACINAIYTCGVSESVCDSWQSGFLYPPLNFNDDYLVGNYYFNLQWTPPQVFNTDSVPQGLSHFNIYLNDSIIDTLLYYGQSVYDTIDYLFDSLVPDKYLFNVSAAYNLELYGYPGEFAESNWTQTDTVRVVWGKKLPFYEGWNSESFFENNWIIDDSAGNWRINSEKGNPKPVAEFYWEPEIVSGYSSSVKSTFLRADSLSEGTLKFEFDLRLRDRNETSEEKLKVELFDGNIWHLLEEFSNTGTYNYSKHTYDISELAEKKIFNIRFTAYGNRTRDIYGWYIDNVSVYRDCDAPENLFGEVDFFTFDDPAILITWEGPYDPGPIAEWLHWDDGVNFTSMGFTSGGTFSVAARWEPEQLVDYDEAAITKIQYYIKDGITEIFLNIWKGNNAETLLYEYDVTDISLANSWNEVVLETPILLDVDEELWVGYTLTHDEGFSPVGVDQGPAIINYGDMINIDGTSWENLFNFGLNYNWNIQVFIQQQVKSKKAIPLNKKIDYHPSDSKLIVGSENYSKNKAKVSDSRFVSEYNIYRMSSNGSSEYELYDFVPYYFGQTDYFYYDTIPNVNLQNGYSYKVTANWQSNLDYCESNPALSKLNPDEDFVYVFLEDIPDNTSQYAIKVFPNPARDYVTIEASSNIKSVRILNLKGQTIRTINYPDEMIINFGVKILKQGVYLLKIETKEGIFSKRLVITR